MGYLNLLCQRWSNFRQLEDSRCGHWDVEVQVEWNGETFPDIEKLKKLRYQGVRHVHEKGEIMAEEENNELEAKFFCEY